MPPLNPPPPPKPDKYISNPNLLNPHMYDFHASPKTQLINKIKARWST